MDYYHLELLDNDVRPIESRHSLLHTISHPRVLINFSTYDYVVVSADEVSARCKKFEDGCRRYLYGISPIKMGFTENKELDMIRTEMKVLVLRVLQRELRTENTYGLRFDEHIVEKIDLKKFVYMHKVDLLELMVPYAPAADLYIEVLLRELLKEIGVSEDSECEYYMVENRGNILSYNAIIEKFYFFQNASQRRIVSMAYRLMGVTEESESTSGTETENEDDNVEGGGDASRSNSEVGDDPEIADETE